MGATVGTAARALRAGQLVVYPTDTLWGLGALATQSRGVERLIRAKRRPGGLPLSVAVSSLEELEEWATLTPARRAFIRRYLPGPVTVIL
ncbi:MAG TPA: Sua5/YciO/YrdC/YwlC family protein, partial [Thermoplasmata archaeon]|nr:Sua5/YciO/YrdC/YwlC family protein [Thermoplasmata archaeon]